MVRSKKIYKQNWLGNSHETPTQKNDTILKNKLKIIFSIWLFPPYPSLRKNYHNWANIQLEKKMKKMETKINLKNTH